LAGGELLRWGRSRPLSNPLNTGPVQHAADVSHRTNAVEILTPSEQPPDLHRALTSKLQENTGSVCVGGVNCLALEVQPKSRDTACRLIGPPVHLAGWPTDQRRKPLRNRGRFSRRNGVRDLSVQGPTRLQVPSQPLNCTRSSELKLRRQKTYEHD